MAIEKDNKKVGIKPEKQPKKKKTITSVVDKVVKKQDKDGEAGVDAQEEYLNDTPDLDKDREDTK